MTVDEFAERLHRAGANGNTELVFSNTMRDLSLSDVSLISCLDGQDFDDQPVAFVELW